MAVTFSSTIFLIISRSSPLAQIFSYLFNLPGVCCHMQISCFQEPLFS